MLKVDTNVCVRVCVCVCVTFNMRKNVINWLTMKNGQWPNCVRTSIDRIQKEKMHVCACVRAYIYICSRILAPCIHDYIR